MNNYVTNNKSFVHDSNYKQLSKNKIIFRKHMYLAISAVTNVTICSNVNPTSMLFDTVHECSQESQQC